MYDLQLDVRLLLAPPMDRHGAGIRFTRRLQLPFPPYDGLILTGGALEKYPVSEGRLIQKVIWDLGRSRFTAETTEELVDFPIACLPEEIARYVDVGWELGSYLDDWQSDDWDEPEADVDALDTPTEEFDDDAARELQQIAPRRRGKAFNKTFHALIRAMCEVRNAEDVAYAMWKSKVFFTEEELKSVGTRAARQYQQAKKEYFSLSWEEQQAWHDRVCKNYPRLSSILP